MADGNRKFSRVKDADVLSFTSVLRGLADDLRGLVSAIESSPKHNRILDYEPASILLNTSPDSLLARIQRSPDPALEICIDAYLLGSEISEDSEIFASHISLLNKYQTTCLSADPETGASALHFAAGSGSNNLTKILLDRKISVDIRDKSLRTPIFWASAKNKFSVVSLLLASGAHPKKTLNAQKNTPLHVAAFYGHASILTLLGQAFPEISVDLAGRGSRTPLHVAASRGNLSSVLSLLELGADCTKRDERGMTAFHHAALGSIDVYRYLATNLPNGIRLRDFEGRTAEDLLRQPTPNPNPSPTLTGGSATQESWIPGNGRGELTVFSPKRLRRSKPEVAVVRWDEVCLKFSENFKQAPSMLQIDVKDCVTKCVRRVWLKNCDFQTDGNGDFSLWFPVSTLPRNRLFAFKTPDSAWSDAVKFPVRICALCKAVASSERTPYCQLHSN